MSFIASIVPDEVLRAFAWTLIHSLWQGAVIALLAAGIVIILRNHRPEIRYTLYCLLLALLPVLFAGTFLFYYNSGISSSQHIMEAGSKTGEGVVPDNIPVISAASENETSNWFLFPAQLIDKQADIMTLIWLAGFFFFLFRFTGSMIFVHRLKNTGLIPAGQQWEKTVKELAMRLELKKKIKLAESMLARIPLTVGYLKPVILLPVGTLSGVPPQQIEAILLHELAHIRRKDYLINVLQSVVEIFFFYHPAAWWISGMIREEREHICDDMVVGINKDHINYIKALTIMEELNSKSPLLANAVTGSRKKLLSRVKRLINPAKFREGFGEGIIIVLIVIGLISSFSMNALSVLPDSHDLTGRESGGKVYNMLPFSRESFNQDIEQKEPVAGPDTIVAKSKSGKVVVKLYTDSTDTDDEKQLQVFVETLEDQVGEMERARDEYNREVIILKKNAEKLDSLRKIVIIKSGDSLKMIRKDTVIVIADDFDTTITVDGGIGFYQFDMPEFKDIPDLSEMPEMSYFYFNEDQIDAAGELERAYREQFRAQREMERMHRELERGQRELDNEWKWVQRNPEPAVKESERIIRQELRDNGLTDKGKKYIIELDGKAMYINGAKQPKETYRKYRKLVESLEQVDFDSGETFKIIF